MYTINAEIGQYKVIPHLNGFYLKFKRQGDWEEFGYFSNKHDYEGFIKNHQGLCLRSKKRLEGK